MRLPSHRQPVGALGGHEFRRERAPVPALRDGLFSVWEMPGLWRCLNCHLLVPDYLLREGFYYRPCSKRRPALLPAASEGEE